MATSVDVGDDIIVYFFIPAYFDFAVILQDAICNFLCFLILIF